MDSYKRKDIRLEGFDYSAPYHYFVTLCMKNRSKLFAPKISEKYQGVAPVINRLNTQHKSDLLQQKYTSIAESILLDLEKYYTNLEIDFYVFMPDHVHFIIAFQDYVYLRSKTPTQIMKKPLDKRRYTLGDIVKSYKQVCSKKLKSMVSIHKKSIWQPNYYDHIIRDEVSLDHIRKYIANNPNIDYEYIPWSKIDPSL